MKNIEKIPNWIETHDPRSENIGFPNSSSSDRRNSMQRYTNSELSDMHLTYRLVYVNAWSTEQPLRKRFPQRYVPKDYLILRVHPNLHESESLKGNRHSEVSYTYARTSYMKITVLEAVDKNLNTSRLAVVVVATVVVSKNTISVFCEPNPCIHLLQKIQSLLPKIILHVCVLSSDF